MDECSEETEQNPAAAAAVVVTDGEGEEKSFGYSGEERTIANRNGLDRVEMVWLQFCWQTRYIHFIRCTSMRCGYWKFVPNNNNTKKANIVKPRKSLCTGVATGTKNERKQIYRRLQVLKLLCLAFRIMQKPTTATEEQK